MLVCSETVEMKEEKQNKPPRGRFSNEACQRLLALYDSGIVKPNKALREELANELDKTPRSIQIWFQNKRAKLKKPSSPDSSDSTPKRKPESLTRLDMRLIEKRRRESESPELSAAIPPSTTSTQSFFEATSPTTSAPTPLRNACGVSESASPNRISKGNAERVGSFPGTYPKHMPFEQSTNRLI
jgi:hypothetical protein